MGFRWEDVGMSRTRRSFTAEFKVEAARRVIDSGRPVAEVGRELNLHENLLRKWVAAEHIRDGATRGARTVPPMGTCRRASGPSWPGCARRSPRRIVISRS